MSPVNQYRIWLGEVGRWLICNDATDIVKSIEAYEGWPATQMIPPLDAVTYESPE